MFFTTLIKIQRKTKKRCTSLGKFCKSFLLLPIQISGFSS